jgi:hypothetical protein
MYCANTTLCFVLANCNAVCSAGLQTEARTLARLPSMSTQRTSFLGTISSKLKRSTVTSASSSSFSDSPAADISGHVSLRQLGRTASSYMFGTTGTAASDAAAAAASGADAYESSDSSKGGLQAHDKSFFASSITAAANASTESASDATADATDNSTRQRQPSLLLQSQSRSRQLSSRQPSFSLTGDSPLVLHVNSGTDHPISGVSTSTSAPQRVGLGSLRKASSSIYSRTGSVVSATSTTTTVATAGAATAGVSASGDSTTDRRGSVLQRSLSSALPSVVQASHSRSPSFLRSGSSAVDANSSSNSSSNTTAAAAVNSAPHRVSIANLRSYSRSGSSFGASLVDTAHSDSINDGNSPVPLQRSSSRSGSFLASIKRMSVRSMSSVFNASHGAGSARQSVSETDFDDQVS